MSGGDAVVTMPGSGQEAHASIRAKVDEIAADLVGISQRLHDNPELAMAEHGSANLLAGALAEAGFRVQRDIDGVPTGFKAAWGGGGPTIAVLCEYDALPGIGHACGHNLIAAGGLGAALALRLAAPDLAGTIVCVGTPGEEGAGGKILELEAGVFDGVDAALMFHPSNKTWPWRRSLAMAAVDVEFRGKAAHAAAYPHLGRSALAGVLQLFTSLDSMRQFVPPTARIHGVIRNGGDAPNVVPEYASAAFMVRDVTAQATQDLLDRLGACARGAAEATGTEVTLSPGPVYAERKNNKVMADRVMAHLSAVGVEADPGHEVGNTGSSDIGNVSLVVPSVHPYVRMAPDGVAAHTREFTDHAGSAAGQAAMLAAAKAMACTMFDLVTDPALLQAVRDEFDACGPDIAL